MNLFKRSLAIFLFAIFCLSCTSSSLVSRHSSGRFPVSTTTHNYSLRSTIGILSPNLRPDGSRYFGCSGVAISETIILTAEHCVDNDTRFLGMVIPGPDPVGDIEQIISYEMYLDTGFSESVSYEVIAVDDPRDIAILRLVEGQELPRGLVWSFLAREGSRMETFDLVYVIGHPVGVNFNTSDGYVSRPIFELNSERYQGERILTNAHVYFGNSGGPVFNSNGEVVGVISEIAGGEPYLNRAVYISSVYDFLQENDIIL